MKLPIKPKGVDFDLHPFLLDTMAIIWRIPIGPINNLERFLSEAIISTGRGHGRNMKGFLCARGILESENVWF